MLYSIINNCSVAVVFHTITFHLILKNKNHLKKHSVELTEYQTKFIRIASLWMGSLKRFHSVTQKLKQYRSNFWKGHTVVFYTLYNKFNSATGKNSFKAALFSVAHFGMQFRAQNPEVNWFKNYGINLEDLRWKYDCTFKLSFTNSTLRFSLTEYTCTGAFSGIQI